MTDWFFDKLRKFAGKLIYYFSNGGGSYTPIPTLEDSCVCHYKLNDNLATTNVIDSKGYSDGTATQNTEDMTVEGKVNSALTFNGTSDYVDTNDTFQDTFRDSFTVNLWANFANMNDLNTLCNQGRISSIFAMRVDYETNLFTFVTAYEIDSHDLIISIDITDYISLNKWVMFTVVIEKLSAISGKIIIYINGEYLAEDTNNDVTITEFASEENLFLGSDSGGDSPLNGSLDNVMIFNRALNSEEIAVLYNADRGSEDFQLTNNLNYDGSELIMEGI